MASDTLDKVRRANIANILKKLTAGKTLTAEETRAVEEFEAHSEVEASARVQPARPMAPDRREFAQLVVGGMKQLDAYRKAFKKPNLDSNSARSRASVIATKPTMVAYIAQLRAASDAHILLSLNERLHILAKAAKLPVRTAAERSATARVIEVYNKTAGDQAPERIETTVRGDPSAPVATQQVPFTKADKIAALLRKRQERLAQRAAAPAAAAAPAP